MSKIEIKNRDGKVIFEHNCEDNTLRKTLEIAVANGANLRGIDLRGSDLRGVNLSGIDLSDSDLRGTYLSKNNFSNETTVN